VRAKDSDDFGALLSEKPAAPAQAPAKRDGWEGFGREANSAEEEKEEKVEVQGEPASWGVLNQIGVEVSARIRLLLSLSCCRFKMDVLDSGENVLCVQHFATKTRGNLCHEPNPRFNN